MFDDILDFVGFGCCVVISVFSFINKKWIIDGDIMLSQSISFKTIVDCINL